jgi:hypothetical protein
MKESSSLVLRELRSKKSTRAASLDARIAAGGLRGESLLIGIAAVIKYQSGLLYYALSHGKAADFHGRRHHLLVHRVDL